MSLFQPPQGDMSTQYPQGMLPSPQFQPMQQPQNMPQGDMGNMTPQETQGASLPMLGGVPAVNSATSNPFPSYTGNATVDKYIHTFIGQS